MDSGTAETPPIAQDIALAYQGMRHALLGFLRNRVGDKHLAEDLLHEVFSKALHAIERGDTPANLTNWLYAIARNSVIDHYRAKRPTDSLPEDLTAPASEDSVVAQDLALCLRPLTESLPPMYRATLLATDFDGLTMQAMADRERVSLSAIKSRASRGRQILKQRLLSCCQVDVSASGQVLDFRRSEPSVPCKAVGASALNDCFPV
jgi:RNA polymerase sigma-70 factor, ECF subfamily